MTPLELRLARAGDDQAQAWESDDDELARLARAGDNEAFATLYDRYRPTLHAICLRKLRDPALAEDVVQDTFVRAYACLDRFDSSRRMLPWLVAIAARRCVDIQRRNGRTQPSDDVEASAPNLDGEDPTFGAVLAGEDRRRLERALRRLHPRQRRALLLYALEGWTYAEIASAEGISVSSTRSLLFHARENLRRACRRGGLLGTLLLPVDAFRDRLRRIGGSIRARTGSMFEPLSAAVAPVTSSIAAVVLSLTALASPASSVAAVSRGEVGRSPAFSVTSGGSPSKTFGAAAAPKASGPRGFTEALLDPTKGATPEDTQFTSIAPSPNYEQDHTLVAAGRVPCPQTWCSVLFVSRDGGQTWVRRATNDFHGHTVLLPPSYPADPRMFAMGPSGLQASTDGGRSFDVVLPIQGDAAISPLFDRADPRILIGASVVTEYWADSELAKPATLIGPVGTWLTVAFSPAYASDHTVFVGGIRPDAGGVFRPTVNRCANSVCRSVVFEEGFDAPWIRPSLGFARDRTVYAFTAHTVFRSVNAGETFSTSTPAFAARANIRDVVVLTDGAVLAAVDAADGAEGGVFRSADGGTTWTKEMVALTGFESGVARIAALADGRLIALGARRGLACSGDGGRSWSARCSG